ncbi:hypothetical protein Tcan_17270 [Toxocara canis]|uniref:Uncharacterized protein n=1 Tax=Toxocara canis TaxID=6265 RepID=A0A0B2VIZ3_TOXCA|nr:hypothetical protein Tcan_17270 [Toxocara canis]
MREFAELYIVAKLFVIIVVGIEGVEKELHSLVEIDPLAVCKKMVNETCHQQLMTSLMLETLAAANRELVMHQQQHWFGSQNQGSNFGSASNEGIQAVAADRANREVAAGDAD